MFIVSGENVRTLKFIAGSGGVAVGDLVVISSGKVVKAAAAATAATVVGVALEAALENGYASVALAQDNIISSEYTGSSKTSLAATDLGTVFDLTDANTVNLDDTTGGICLCVGYDNDVDTINFVVPAAYRYL